MALQHSRLLSKRFINRGSVLSSTISFSKHNESTWTKGERTGEVGQPYRPSPLNMFFWPKSEEYWSKTYPQRSEKDDEYESEEVYLDEIESRMRKFDKKHSQSKEVKKLYNQYGWYDFDDRAFTTYGGGLSGENDELQYGRGKKIDPAQYINPDITTVSRKAISPIQYLTAEQVRRSRGTLSNMRELPPETPSIWKSWNMLTTGLVFGALCVAKEFFILGGHDMWDAILYWSIFGVAGSVIADNVAWMNALISQEHFDREFFLINERLQQINKSIEAIETKPDEKTVLLGMAAYRSSLSEKVLQRTLSNRVARLVDNANKKLNDKMGEEAQIKKDAESGWQRDALEQTLNYFDDSKVKQEFMKEAINAFCQPNVASLKASNTQGQSASVDLFKAKYDQFYQSSKATYLKDKKANGSLSWVFIDQNERSKLRMSEKDKESAFTKKIKEWEQSHNPVNAQIPSFA